MKKLKSYDQLEKKFRKRVKRAIGYPCTQDFDFSKISRFLNYHINNVGSSFQPAIPYALNTHKYEVEIIKHFVELYGGDISTHKGYLGSGSTEMNLYGMYLGREQFNNYCTVVHSSSAHYSVPKAAKLLNLTTLVVEAYGDGSFNYQRFDEQLQAQNNLISPVLQKPLIIMATLGTTMHGAIDNVDKLIEICKNNNRKYYIHCDAAFLGPMLPYMDGSDTIRPSFDKENIDSISMSAHKFIGCAVPCGIMLAKETHMERVCEKIQYIHSNDYTITGSRCGLAALMVYDQLTTVDFNVQVKKCLKLSNYAVKKINETAGYEMAQKHKFSTTIVIDKPKNKIVKKWFLAVENDIAHIIISPQTSKKTIKKFCHDLITM